MGSPSRNVQYHPPRLSEDRLNLPQPHSPSLPTHCSGKSGMRPSRRHSLSMSCPLRRTASLNRAAFSSSVWRPGAVPLIEVSRLAKSVVRTAHSSCANELKCASASRASFSDHVT